MDQRRDAVEVEAIEQQGDTRLVAVCRSRQAIDLQMPSLGPSL
jgi:hypothetical protein